MSNPIVHLIGLLVGRLWPRRGAVSLAPTAPVGPPGAGLRPTDLLPRVIRSVEVAW